MASKYSRVASLKELPEGGLLGVVLGDKKLVLAHPEAGVVRAFDGICTHQYADLADGEIDEGMLWCPFHGAAFDVHTGIAACLPATEPLGRYDVRVEGDDILVCPTPIPAE
jgi:nitrite reductase/ring-hydroxylating ferredoxin subunit